MYVPNQPVTGEEKDVYINDFLKRNGNLKREPIGESLKDVKQRKGRPVEAKSKEDLASEKLYQNMRRYPLKILQKFQDRNKQAQRIVKTDEDGCSYVVVTHEAPELKLSDKKRVEVK